MGKVIAGLIAVAGIWVGLEFMNEGPSRAFDGMFADLLTRSGPSAEAKPIDERSTAQRAGDSVARARDEAEARRTRMLGE
jgi:hypothetical protein